MTTPTVAVTIVSEKLTGVALAGGSARFTPTGTFVSGTGSTGAIVVPQAFDAGPLDNSGTFVANIVPNVNVAYQVQFFSSAGNPIGTPVVATIPGAPVVACYLHDCLTTGAPVLSDAQRALNGAQAAQAAAQVSQGAAAGSASAAAGSASAAAGSASAAAGSASSAAGSAATASGVLSDPNFVAVSTDLPNINTVATNIAAVNSAATNMAAITAAPTQASNAATSATSAAASLVDLKNRYMGAFASDPATRPDGSALTAGCSYFNTTSNLFKVYNGAIFQASDINTANLAASGGAALIGQGSKTVADYLAAIGNAATGETGIVNPMYPAGDVRRYGVFPDGVDLTGLTFTNLSPTVSGAAGTFTASMIGMVVCSPNVTGSTGATVPKIIAVAGDGSSCTLNANAVASQAGAGARVGTYWERDHASYTNAILANSILPNVEIYWPPGKYVTSLNFGTSYSGAKMFFDNVEWSSIFHLIADAGFPGSAGPLTNVKMRGYFTTWDRFGAIGLQNSDLSHLNVFCKSDATKSLSGLVGRGVHIYSQMIGTTFGNFTIDDCGVGTAINTDGAFVMDSSDCQALVIGDVWIKDSAGQGAFIVGTNHRIRSLRVDAWGYGAADRQIAETVTLAQCQELTGVWLRRCAGLHINDLRIGQSASARPNALYDFRIEDTANAVTAPASYSRPRIDSLYCSNIKHRGMSVGDRNNAVTRVTELSVGVLQVQPVSGATLDAGYSMVHANANSASASAGRNSLSIERLVAINPSASINDLLQWPALTDVTIGLIDTSRMAGHAGRVLTLNGRGSVGRIVHQQAGGSGSPVPFTINPDGVTYIGPIDAAAASLTTITALDLTGASNFEIGPVNLTNYRGSPAIKMISGSQGKLKLGTVQETSAIGWGLRFQGNTNVRVEGGKITGFALGTTGSAGGNTRCSANNVQVTGNTTNTDLANGQALVDSTCLNFTL